MKKRGIIIVISCLVALVSMANPTIFVNSSNRMSTIPEIVFEESCGCFQKQNQIGVSPSDSSYSPLHFLFHDGLIRSYRLHIPPSYNSSQATPLVLILHGGGGRSVTMETKTDFSTMSDQHGFIAVYPNGISRFLSLRRMWNGGYCCGIALDTDTDDVGFIENLIKNLQSELNVDPARIYITGHSNGGIMAYRLGAELSHLVAAIAPVAGAIGGKETEDSPLYTIPEPLFPVSVIAFHGKLDENVPYDGGQGNRSRRYGSDVSVNESIAFWVRHIECDPIPETKISESQNIVHDIYKNGRNGTEVHLYTIVNGGHGWPGSDRGDRPTQELSATEIMWDFFMSHPKQ
jgi:polyhydroxybutyrate depolymerase